MGYKGFQFLGIALVLFMTAYGQDRMKNESVLFEDHFDGDSTSKWADMFVWGFGVWKVDDGSFISSRGEALEPALFAALPKVDRAVVRRDFSILFRYRPIQGTFQQFGVQVRQSGLSHYVFTFDSDGSLKIVKVRSGLPNLVLAASQPGIVRYDTWQWIRLKILGDDPASFSVTCWTGIPDDEPSSPQICGLDRDPLPQANFSLALVSTQQGGARTMLDDFMVQGLVPGSRQWTWIETSTGTTVSETDFWKKCSRFFLEGDRTSLRSALEEAGNLFPASWIVDNNRAVFHADQRHFDRAVSCINRAFLNAPDNTAVLSNMKLLWKYLYNASKDPDPSVDRSPLVWLRTDRKVIDGTGVLHLETGVLLAQIPKKDRLSIRGTLSDSSGQRIDSFHEEIPVRSVGIWRNTRALNSPFRSDGMHTWHITLCDGETVIAEDSCKVEWIGKGFESVFSRTKEIRRQADAVFAQGLPEGIKADWASVLVRLVSVQRQLSFMDQPGFFARLKENLNRELDQIVLQADSVRSGEKIFDHRRGQFLRGYYSEVDRSVQGYALWVPPSYRNDRPMPLVVNLHGYDPTFSAWEDNIFIPVFMPFATAKNRYILANPFGRGNTMYQGIGEGDVIRVIEEIRRRYNVDDRRICLVGGSMGGGGTWHVGLSFPDRFAAIAPIMGPTDFGFWAGPRQKQPTPYRQFFIARSSPLSLAENAFGLPVLCNHGAKDDIVPVEQSRRMVQRFHDLGYPITYIENPQAMHGGFEPDMEYRIYDWFENKETDSHPDTIVFKTGDMRHSRAYGVQITRFLNPLQFASIAIRKTSSGNLVCRTENVARFTLTLNGELCNLKNGDTITIDETKLKISPAEDDAFLTVSMRIRTDGKISSWEIGDIWKGAVLEKKPGLSGPIQDVLQDPFLLVYGTGGSDSERKVNLSEADSFSDRWEAWQHVRIPTKADTEITENDIAHSHLILFGNARTNLFMASIADRLPIRCDGTGITIGNKKLTGKNLGLAMVYPNPRNPERYAVILGGVEADAMDGMTRRIGSDYDYIVFDDRTVGIPWPGGNHTIDGTPVLCGVFDSEWRLSPDLQWQGDSRLRKTIRGHRPWSTSKTTNKRTLYLSDATPILGKDQINQVEKDRTFWGTSLNCHGKFIKKGIGVFPNSRMVYHLDGSWDRFSSWVKADENPFVQVTKESYRGGFVQFAVYGDGVELSISQPLNLFSEPCFIDVPVQGVKTLELVVRTQDWLPYFAQAASWTDVKLEKQ